MSQVPPIIAAAMTLMCVAPLASQDIANEADYAKSMTEIRFLMGDANQHVDARYWPELADDVSKLKAQFEAVEAFWTARGTDAAVALAQEAIGKLEPVLAAADNKNPQAAEAAVQAIRSTCQSCHQQFREETADGFRIKPSVE